MKILYLYKNIIIKFLITHVKFKNIIEVQKKLTEINGLILLIL